MHGQVILKHSNLRTLRSTSNGIEVDVPAGVVLDELQKTDNGVLAVDVTAGTNSSVDAVVPSRGRRAKLSNDG